MERLDEGAFLEASRHVPKLLRHQLLCHLTSNYLMHEAEPNQKRNHSIFSTPSMERFYGAVLFVDISGFTALSLKLDVESLKNHINDYFSKMLAVIEKWNGDVIKFAGDALYIVWPVELSELSSDVTCEPKSMESLFAEAQFLEAARAAVNRAINCALEINYCCCHHKIIIGENVHPSKQRWTKLFNVLPVLLGPTEQNKPNEKQTSEEEVAYLNVHSGIGFGLVAGVDIGGNDRWEYFLLGEPLTQCAEAESKATMGELIVSSIVHSLFHYENEYHETEIQVPDKVNQELPCSCFLLEGQYFRITCQPASGYNVSSGENSAHTNASSRTLGSVPSKKNLLRALSKGKLETLYVQNPQDEFEAKDSHRLEDLKDEIQQLVSKVFPTFKEVALQFIAENKISLLSKNLNGLVREEEEEIYDDEDAEADDEQVGEVEAKDEGNLAEKTVVGATEFKEQEEHFIRQPMTSSARQRRNQTLIAKFVDKQIRPSFINWLQKCVLDDLLRHTHEAPRKHHEYSQFVRVAAIYEFLQNRFFFHENSNTMVPGLSPSRVAQNLSHAKEGFSFLVKLPRQMSKVKTFVNDVGLSAELRNVTVLFINIHRLKAELMIEPTVDDSIRGKSHSGYAAFNFIQRSAAEREADSRLLSQLQNCIEVICNALLDSGGQLRQFIVDDKGTVCIGTFGLRGSMAVDNAASAIECAKMIVIQLNEINLQASIGITTGKGYCGLVGSKFRHEYAVMGPSTNLSARLMGKAGINQILCDTETQYRDRTHQFTALAAIKAKGYADPVQTFTPVFDDPRYPGVNHDETSARGITRSSLDYTALENLLHQMHTENRPSFLQQGSNRSHSSALPSESTQMRRNSDITSSLLKELLHSTLTVQNRRGSVDLSMMQNRRGSVDLSMMQNRRGSVDMSMVQNRRGSCDFSGFTDKSGTTTTTTISKLYGRNSEIKEIAYFLILPFCRAIPHSEIVLVKSKDHKSLQFKFDVSTSSRLMAVSGKEGFGKSSLVTAIARKLFMMSQTNRNCNLTVLKNRTNTVMSTNPFQSIKSIVQEILIKFSKHIPNESSKESTPNVTGEESGVGVLTKQPSRRASGGRRNSLRASMNRRSGGSLLPIIENNIGQMNTVELQIAGGLQSITGQLSTDHQNLLPLLSSYQIVKGIPENESTNVLTGKGRLFAALDLICAIIDLYGKVTGHVVFFVCEKLHLFDSWSLSCINQIWRHAKGVMILCTYNPVVKDSSSYSGSVRKPPDSLAEMPSMRGLQRPKGLKKILNMSSSTSRPTLSRSTTVVFNITEAGFDSDVFCHQYSEDPSRFKLLSLQLLDKESIQSITRDTVTTAASLRGTDEMNDPKADLISDALMQKVYDMSGGNPLYATAIVNSVNLSEIAKLNAEMNANSDGGGDNTIIEDRQLDELLLSATNRIGEVICYRFDQLDTLTQVILKSAAVICSSPQAEFTLETLLFLMYDEGESRKGGTKKSFSCSVSTSSDYEIVNCLRSLLVNEEFIQLVDLEKDDQLVEEGKDTVPAQLKDNSIDDEMIIKGRFSFRVILEQMTIYDLLVDEQKQQIHEGIAIYYHQLIYFSGSTTPNIDHILAEAFHWQLAKVNPYAVLCHNQAAVFYKQHGDYENMKVQLKLADEFHSIMRQEIGLFPLSGELSVEYLLEVYEEYDSDVALQVGAKSTKSRFSENSTMSPLQERSPSARLASCSEDTNDRGFIDKTKYLPAVASLPHIPLICDQEGHSIVKSLSTSHDEVEKTNSALQNVLPEAPALQVQKIKSILPSKESFYNDRNAQLLADMCLGDGEAFCAILSTQIMIAQSYCMTFENPTLVLTVLEDCLMLLLLYNKYILRNIPNTTTTNASPREYSKPDSANTEETETSNEDDESPKKLKPSRTVRFTNDLEEKPIPPPLSKLPTAQKSSFLNAFLVESFETYLCQVYALYIWIVGQSPVGSSGGNGSWIKKSWFLCDRYLTLVSQTPAFQMLSRLSAHSGAPGGNSSHTSSILHQKSKRFLSQKFLSFKNAPLSAQSSQTIANDTFAPTQHKIAFLGVDKSQMRSKAHSTHSTCLYILHLLRDGQLSKAVKKCDRVLLSYSIRKYSKTLIEIYGFDITQYTITMLCQELLLVGEIEKCFNYFTIIFENIYHLKDYYSIFLTYLPLFSVCVALRKFSDAMEVLLLVEEYEKRTFHVQVFHPLIKLEMKYFLTMAKIIWDDDRDRADEDQQPKQKNQEMNYYHRFLRNSFAKSHVEESPVGLFSLTKKQIDRMEELNELSVSYQSQLEATTATGAKTANDLSSTNSADVPTPKGLNDLAVDDFLFLYESKEQDQSYFGYFLHQHGCAIESILICVKMLQYVAQHQEADAFSSIHLQRALKIFERQYEAMIRLKSRYIIQNTEEQQQSHCNVYSELICFSILLSLYNDLRKQIIVSSSSSSSSSCSAIATSLELSSNMLMELEQLLNQSERCSYSLSLAIFSESILTTTNQQQQLSEPKEHPQGNDSPSSVINRSPQNSMITTNSSSSSSPSSYYYELAQRMKEKGYSHIQQNHNSSQLKGFEYLITRMMNL